MKPSYLLLSSMTVGLLGADAMACFQPPTPPPRVWSELHGPGDLWVWVEVADVFGTETTHPCSCGVGLGNTATPISPLLQVADTLTVGVFNTVTKEIVRSFAQFDELATDANSTAGWRNGPAMPDPDIGAPNPGANWFGFGGNVGAVNPGVLEQDEIWIFCFNLTWDPAQFTPPGEFPAQYGAGLGISQTDLGPLFDPDNMHTSRYSGEFIIVVPGTSAGALLLAAAPLGARRRRR